MKKIIIYIISILLLSGVCCVCIYMQYTPDVMVEAEMHENALPKAEKNEDKQETDRKKVFLTFDDGPSENTEKIADILEENDARATFFVIGCQLTDETKEVVTRLRDNGNQIGVHTYSHEADCIYCSEGAYYDDIMKTEIKLISFIEVAPSVYRFPWGSDNCFIRGYRKKIIERLRKKGLEYCDWNVSGEDSVGSPSAAVIYNNVKSNYDMFDEPVVLLHDSAANVETVKALPDVIKLYKEAGYDFGILGERSELLQWKK